ncbi:MAG: UxaA family hydrolase [Chloroflexota bacterium]
MSFLGYPRPCGLVGTRNHIGIFSTVACANDVAWWIARRVKSSVPFIHGQGCSQTLPDLGRASRTLVSLGWNPNLAGVLLVSLGCESVSVDEIAKGIRDSGKPVAKVVIQEKGAKQAVKEGIRLAREMAETASKMKREEFLDSALVLGIKCGGSDTTSGLISNPAAGALCDRLLERGGTCLFGETTEFIGAEHVLSRRAVNREVGDRIKEIVLDMEKTAMAMGCDIRGGQPTRGNIAGGITTIEEKSLGAIAKGGSYPIQGVFEYGERASGKGLFIVDTPGREPEFLTGLAAAGVNVIVFTTGLGAPQGFPFVPVIKVTGNPQTWARLPEHIDQFIKFTGKSGIGAAGEALYRRVLAVASGKKTKAERLNYGNFPNITTLGPVI